MNPVQLSALKTSLYIGPNNPLKNAEQVTPRNKGGKLNARTNAPIGMHAKDEKR
ncbi:MAG: hypothetical protein ACR2PX_25610 [Endozoicomonas sp.]|uniref:hypothetical protein n=1 Tax=Endozoicomonas sp. TaxID=1892382 RepID=UPI003D9BEBDD